jgi:hypothetical protein
MWNYPVKKQTPVFSALFIDADCSSPPNSAQGIMFVSVLFHPVPLFSRKPQIHAGY